MDFCCHGSIWTGLEKKSRRIDNKTPKSKANPPPTIQCHRIFIFFMKDDPFIEYQGIIGTEERHVNEKPEQIEIPSCQRS